MSQSADWITTARVLRRAGFGTTGTAVDAAASGGDVASNVSALIGAPFADDPGVIATPIPAFVSTTPLDGSPLSANENLVKELREQNRELTRWWLRRMTLVEHPLLEKLTFLWHNHFATRIGGVRSAGLMAGQNEAIRRLCLGNFRELALTMLTDGAMLRWLSGNSNTKRSPNENLAREFMELFALGRGNGYTESDVKEGARALTGWVVGLDERVRFQNKRHDDKSKSVLGVTGKLDVEAFCDIVLDHPNSPRFVATRLWRQLAADSPPSASTLEGLIAAYGKERDLKALTYAVLTADEFLGSGAALVNGPVDWFIGLVRTLRVSTSSTETQDELANHLRALGQLPLNPPSVGGWPGGQAWLSTATARLRMRATRMAIRQGDITAIDEEPESQRIDAVGYLLGVGSWSDSTVKTLADYKNHPANLVLAAANSPEYLTT